MVSIAAQLNGLEHNVTFSFFFNINFIKLFIRYFYLYMHLYVS